MRAEDWKKQELELEGWPVLITSYQIGDSYVTEVESTTSGATIARATRKSRNEAEQEALEAAARRLLRTRRSDLGLTVGG